ncbi:phosphoglycerate mutase [Paenibacillus mucilaginosus 3016]|uniref:Phosphoglycerate mutase n=2 Tax=Paenibacillus mucilaginosus TaxID=61624 RepID=H6NM30_9BACL|nr:histidine phosphatase family protein [Paenibacillus mucilaginosus]AFC32448.1 phosphoglycerate mutase [Paenibacillus mucilaginosus 3016]AFH64761.1 phosphoglycerate kinase [Paenibacillus mucilaginosus K02]WFA20931.1 histidine phosphatase family protein [Paenibacillus mucilaginosus]
MAAELYLVRHAKKEKGIGDAAISSEGMRQAQATARHFRGLPITQILCSPLQRAKMTAAIIAKGTGTVLTEDHRLRERANWGDIPGQTFEDFVEMWDRCTLDRDFSPPAGDSARQAGERLASCLLDLSASHPQGPLLVVTHGGLITDFLVQVIPEAELNKLHPRFIAEQSRLVAECSITTVRCEDGRFSLVDFAAVEHLL